ncbi:hypothetical protein IGJ48_002220 [Enterococcus pernyi]
MATAFVLFHFYGISESMISFSTQSGNLFVTKKEQKYAMDFPSILPQPIAILTAYEQAIGTRIKEAYLARDLFFVLEDEETVAKLTPDYTAMRELEEGVGVIVTAKGKKEDFVSRTFFPKLTINEDPVCGSAHANLIPYWAQKLGKDDLVAQQLSARGGFLTCKWLGERVMISGEATLFAKGEAYI